MRKKTTAEFIADARKVHGDKYGYEKAVYDGAHNKMVITCHEHGDFEQTPNNHLKGRGCPACGGSQRSDTESFILKARQVHGDKYGYEKAVYEGNKIGITITCLEHGDFEQTPQNHLSGYGCPACGGTQRLDTESFILKARQVHGDRYGYEKVVYKNTHKSVTITCHEHGDFEQTPNNHLFGQGCPHCDKSHTGSGLVYVLTVPGSKVKIGKVKNQKSSNMGTRIRRMFTSQRKHAPDYDDGGIFQVMGLYRFGDGSFVDAGKAERKAHRHFKAVHIKNLPKFDGSNEYFKTDWQTAASYLESIGGVRVDDYLS